MSGAVYGFNREEDARAALHAGRQSRDHPATGTRAAPKAPVPIGAPLVRARLDEALTAGNKADATIRIWDEADESWSNGQTIECRLATDIEMANGDEGWAMWYSGIWWITPVACPE